LAVFEENPMNLFGLMETSGDAMQAERMRAEVVAANMANAETTRTATGGPYHRQHVVFAANPGLSPGLSPDADGFAGSLAASIPSSGSPSILQGSLLPQGLLAAPTTVPEGGVHIAGVIEDLSPPLKRYDPGHPDAAPDGYVSYPDINPITEMVDLMGATRAYGMNSSAVQAEKGMITSALEIAKS
jgi:flagellar basal-body rod protein FlgC